MKTKQDNVIPLSKLTEVTEQTEQIVINQVFFDVLVLKNLSYSIEKFLMATVCLYWNIIVISLEHSANSIKNV
jgi:hypothetical protein